MKVKSYTLREFDKLKKYKLDRDVPNTESVLYLTKIKDGYTFKDYILKKLFILSADSLANKLSTVLMLGDYGYRLDAPELVLPEHQVLIDNQISGFTIPYIKGQNLGTILSNFHTSDEQAFDYFKKVGKVLDHIQTNSAYAFPGGTKFQINDLHPYNILVDENGELKFVDLDSAYLGSRLPNPSMYLATSKELLSNTNKYPVINLDYGHINIPNDNTDLYCYNMMILEYIAREKVRKLKVEDYYEYLSYLSGLGYGKDIMDSFYRLPISSNNVNPYECLDQIPKDMIGRSSYHVYQYLKKK